MKTLEIGFNDNVPFEVSQGNRPVLEISDGKNVLISEPIAVNECNQIPLDIPLGSYGLKVTAVGEFVGRIEISDLEDGLIYASVPVEILSTE